MSRQFFTYNFQKILNAIQDNPFNKVVDSEFDPIQAGVVDINGETTGMGFLNSSYMSDYWGRDFFNNNEPAWGLNMDIARGYYIKIFNGVDENDETSYEITGDLVYDMTECEVSKIYNNYNSIIRLLCNIINNSSDTSFNRIGIYKKIANKNTQADLSSTYTYALVGVIELDTPVPFNAGDNYAITVQLTREITNG